MKSIKKIEDTSAYIMLENRNSLFIDKIKNIYKYAEDLLPKINIVFSDYTGHDILHSLNVIEYMYDLCESPHQLSDLEVVVMIYVALLHDCGMVVTQKEIDDIKIDKNNTSNIKYSSIFNKYQNTTMALQEYIRPIHGMRSYNHINDMEKSFFILPENTIINFQEDVAKICAAHNENFLWIKDNISLEQKKGNYNLNSQFIALLLRIADYLDVDEERAPHYLYKLLQPQDLGDLEWKQHYIIENKKKIVNDNINEIKNIEFYGQSSDPNIYRKLLKYINNLNEELLNATEYSKDFREKKYLLNINPNVINNIETKGFKFANFNLNLNYNAVTKLLMGEKIYGNKKYGLREIIQNSIDACLHMKEEAEHKEEFKYNPYSPSINIILDYNKKEVCISDNGMGMSMDILKNYFLNVGVSYYTSDQYLFRGNKYSPIGNYGIGFLACFMLSDNVKVITRYYGENNINSICFKKNSEYICLNDEKNFRFYGTDIMMPGSNRPVLAP